MRFGGIVLATALMLGGCSSDPEPREPKSSAAPAPTATVPTMPAQATENSPEGAAAFVKHYVDVFNYAAATGDVSELTRLSSPECEPCSKYASRFDAIYSSGDRISKRLWTLSDSPLKLFGTEQVNAKVQVNEGPTKNYEFAFRLSRSTTFHVENITILEQS